MTDVQPRLDGETLEAAMRQVLRTGRPVLDLHLRGRPKSDPSRERVCSNPAFRLCDASDRPVGVCCLFLNITERVPSRLGIRSRSRAPPVTDPARTRGMSSMTGPAVPGSALRPAQ
ncbi:hypothetical protein GCM10014715_23080 [Streptomyces spiralis]|uniref:PAS fold-4 domain-containing protein n=1 Tax=Streptomyces spiralis TaxID=66376 RepID=A0A918ZU45_9ACTN|nr:hypothetical protein GCM10014715_23080 [Streptomyces spiralis]